MDAAGNHYGPYDATINPEAEDYTEGNYYRFHRRSGVLSGGGITFVGLTGTLAAIEARARGSFYWRDSSLAISSPANTAASPRRDLLVLRRTQTVGGSPGSTVPVLLQGAAAVSPVDPVYVADTDEPLWSWQVPANSGTAITDVRDLRRFIDDNGVAPHALLHGSGVQPIVTTAALTTWTVVSLATVVRTSGLDTATTGRLTVTRAGIYLVSGTVGYAAHGSATGHRRAGVLKNGAIIEQTVSGMDLDSQGSVTTVATAAYPMALAVGDYIQLATTHNHGHNLDVERARSFLQAHFIAPTSV